MALGIRALAAKPDGLRLVDRTYMLKQENQLGSPSVCYGMQYYIQNRINVNIFQWPEQF